VALILAAAFIWSFAMGSKKTERGTPPATSAGGPQPSALKEADSQRFSTAEIAARCSPSVVVIETSNGNGQPLGQGSGYIYSTDGVIITNYHVVRGAGAVRVKVPAQGWVDATSLLGYDTAADVAALQISASGLPALDTETGNEGKVGDRVVAIGAPLGLEDTVSEGIISAFRRNGDAQFLQITASISPGSSGGPVLNESGRVVGIAKAMMPGGESLNFAVPAATIQSLLASRSEVSFEQMREATRTELPLAGSTFEVPPRHQYRLSFMVPGQGADLQGDFRIIGGFGRDVVVTLLSANGGVVSNLGRVSGQGEVHQHLMAGRYLLAFDNGFSLLAAKSVTPDIKLVYYR
jgi:hypothetical protein